MPMSSYMCAQSDTNRKHQYPHLQLCHGQTGGDVRHLHLWHGHPARGLLKQSFFLDPLPSYPGTMAPSSSCFQTLEENLMVGAEATPGKGKEVLTKCIYPENEASPSWTPDCGNELKSMPGLLSIFPCSWLWSASCFPLCSFSPLHSISFQCGTWYLSGLGFRKTQSGQSLTSVSHFVL